MLDAKGSFVRDLAGADIEVLEDGVPQAISEFTLVDLSSAPAPSPLAVPSSCVLSPADLERLPGRLYVFLLQINVRRPGVEAFYRSGYLARRP